MTDRVSKVNIREIAINPIHYFGYVNTIEYHQVVARHWYDRIRWHLVCWILAPMCREDAPVTKIIVRTGGFFEESKNE